jgi:hypothetical protein
LPDRLAVSGTGEHPQASSIGGGTMLLVREVVGRQEIFPTEG